MFIKFRKREIELLKALETVVEKCQDLESKALQLPKSKNSNNKL